MDRARLLSHRTALAVAAVVLLGGGCGDDGRAPAPSAATAPAGSGAAAPTGDDATAAGVPLDAYEAQVLATAGRMTAFGDRLARVRGLRLRRSADGLDEAQRRFHRELVLAAGLRPPTALRPAHRRLLRAWRRMDVTMRQLVAAARDDDPDAFRRANARFAGAARAVEAAGRAYGAAR